MMIHPVKPIVREGINRLKAAASQCAIDGAALEVEVASGLGCPGLSLAT
jgi:hypothetical protein